MKKLGKKLPRLGAALALFAALGLAVAVSGCSNSGDSVPLILPPGLTVTPFPPTALPDGTDGTAGKIASYVTFGKWPQTLKADSVTVDEDDKEVHGAFTYCKGDDGAWYVKIRENTNSGSYTYSDGTTPVKWHSDNSWQWFKVEPIKWRVLTTDYSGKKLLLAENVLIGKRYDDDKNNYKNSEIRAWLNGDFLKTAFTAGEQAAIATTSVVNDARSTNPESNANRWGDGKNLNASDTPTRDKVFLLSEQEVTNGSYVFYENEDAEDPVRIRNPTDFALASGASTNSFNSANDGGPWWLRSPHYDALLCNNWVYYIGVSGSAPGAGAGTVGACNKTEMGVVPALCVSN